MPTWLNYGSQMKEKFILERSARLNLDPGKGDKGDGVDGVTDDHL